MYDEAADLAGHRHEIENIRREMRLFNITVSGYERCLDVGGGSGFHTPWLTEMAHNVVVADKIDYLNHANGTHGHSLRNRFARNSIAMDHGRTQFHCVDACDLIYRDGLFDLVISINAFEHIVDPELAFAEIIRVTRPGGTVVLQFDPIWNSPVGHHLPDLKLKPWQHLVEDEETFIRSIRSAGGTDADVMIFQNDMNRVSYRGFMEILEGPASRAFSKLKIQRWARTIDEEERADHPNFTTMVARGMAAEELFVRGILFIGVKEDGMEQAAVSPAKSSLFSRALGKAHRAITGRWASTEPPTRKGD